MEVIKISGGFYTVRLNKDEQSNIARFAEAWCVKGVEVIPWLLVGAINDAIRSMDKIDKHRKGGKNGDKGK